MSHAIIGGCHCGEVRYRIRVEPLLQQFCYCTDCTVIGGTDGYAGYIIDAAGFEVTQGEPKAYTLTSDRGNLIHRKFCSTCGTRLWAEVGGSVSVAAASLDNPALFKPTRNILTQSAPPWSRYSDCLHDSKKLQ